MAVVSAAAAAAASAVTRAKMTGWELWRSIGSPRFVMAPMVDQSELAFRMMCRRYGVQLCYSPMIHSRLFLQDEEYRNTYFTTSDEDRGPKAPLFVQFCGNDPDVLLAAARLAEDRADAIDINLGCPQGIARKGFYGAFLMEDRPLIYRLVRSLHENLKVPVTCKIRRYATLEETLEYARGLVAAGCQILAVHGRTRDMKGPTMGLADWDVIKAVKQAVDVPVIANGNIRCLEDVENCLRYTGVDAVMSAEGLLSHPDLFIGPKHPVEELAVEFCRVSEQYNNHASAVKAHLFSMLRSLLDEHVDLRDKLHRAKTPHAMSLIAEEVQQRVRNSVVPLVSAEQRAEEVQRRREQRRARRAQAGVQREARISAMQQRVAEKAKLRAARASAWAAAHGSGTASVATPTDGSAAESAVSVTAAPEASASAASTAWADADSPAENSAKRHEHEVDAAAAPAAPAAAAVVTAATAE